MDLRTWKKVLLQWVHECSFIERNYITLEQTDIEGFFTVYVQKAEAETEVAQALHAQLEYPTQSPGGRNTLKPTALQAFIKETYPEFTLHMDNYGHIVGADFLYVYTLLLHYTCVKRPCEFFHSICKKLPDVTQTCVAAFFQQSMDRPQLTRDCLRQAIANVASCVLRTPEEVMGGCLNPPDSTPRARPRRSTPNSLSPDSDGSENSSSLGEYPDDPLPEAAVSQILSTLSAESPGPPASTPLHREQKRVRERAIALATSADSAEMQAPPTPKTELLEQRTKELLGLRAQLETERYEKNVLEEQIMENEHLINSLTKENKVKKIQLAKLKADRNDEADGEITNYVPNEFDHLKRSLMKEISQKEAIIAETSDKLQDLLTEKADVENKLKMASEQVVVCMDRIRELELRAEEANQMLTAKVTMISVMERDKQELEQCLQEARDELHNRREVLNASSDLLDCSLSPNTTPENLASSVIDKQLRERELENSELKDELSKMQKSLQQLSEDVKDTLKKFSLPTIQPGGSLTSRLRSAFLIIESGYEAELTHVKDMQEQFKEKGIMYDQLFENNQKMVRESEMQKSEVALLKDQNEDLRSIHQSMLSREEQLRAKIAAADSHLEAITKQLAEKKAELVHLAHNIQNVSDKNKELEDRAEILNLKHDVVQLGQGLLEGREQLETDDWVSTLARIEELIETRNRLICENVELQMEHLLDQNQITNAEERINQLAEQQCSLREELASRREECIVYAEELANLKATHSVVQDERDELNKKYSSALDELSDLSEKYGEITEEQAELKESHIVLTNDCATLKKDHIALNTELSSVLEKLSETKLSLDDANERFTKTYEEMHSSLQQKQQEVAEVQAQLSNAIVADEQALAALKARLNMGSSDDVIRDSLSQIQQMDDTRQVLKADNERLIDLNHKLEAEVQQLKDQFTAADTERLIDLNHKLEVEVQQLKDQIAAADTERLIDLNHKLEVEVQQLKDQIAAADTEGLIDLNHKLEEEVQQLKDQIAAGDNQRLIDLNHKLEEEVQQLKDQIAADPTGHIVKRQNDTIRNLEEVNEKLSSDYAKLQLLHSDMEESLSQAKASKDCIAMQLAESKAKMAQLEESNPILLQRIAELEKAQGIEAQIAEVRTAKLEELCNIKVNSLNDFVQQQLKDREQLHRNDMDDLSADMNVRLKEQEAVVSELENKLVLQLNDLTEQERQISDQKAMLTNQEMQISVLETKYSDEVKAVKEDCARSIQQMEKQTQKLQNELATTNRELRKMTSEHTQMMANAGLRADHPSMDEKLKKLEEAQVRDKRLAQQEIDQLKTKLQKEQEQMRSEIENLILESQKAREESILKEEQLSKSHMELEKSRQEGELGRKEVDRLKGELEEFIEQAQDDRDIKDSLYQEIRALKKAIAEAEEQAKLDKDKLRKHLHQAHSQVVEAMKQEYHVAQKEIEDLREQLSAAQIRFEEEMSLEQEKLVKIKQELAASKIRFEEEKRLGQKELVKIKQNLGEAEIRYEEEKSLEHEELVKFKQKLASAQIQFKEERSLKQDELLKVKHELAACKIQFEEEKRLGQEELVKIKQELVDAQIRFEEEMSLKEDELVKIKRELAATRMQSEEERGLEQEELVKIKQELAASKARFEEERILKEEELAKIQQELASAHIRFEEEMSRKKEELVKINQELASAHIQFKEDRSLKHDELLKIKHELAASKIRFEDEKRLGQEELVKIMQKLDEAQIRFEEERSQKHEELVKIKQELAETHSSLEATKDQQLKLAQEIEAQYESEKAKCTQENERLNEQLREAQEGVLAQMKQVAVMRNQAEKLVMTVSESFEEQLRLNNRQLEEERLNSSQLKADLRMQEQEVRRLRSQLAVQTQRCETDSVALAEYQSEVARLQEELSQVKAAHEEQSAAIETLQREKEALQRELSLIKLRRVGEEREHQVSLEGQLERLEKLRQQSETERAAAHERIIKLEAMRESKEREMCHLYAQLANAEQEKVRLNLEIGGLNSEIEQCRQSLAKQADELVGLQQNMEKAQVERSREQEELAKLREKLDLVHQELDGNRLVHEAQLFELEEKIRDYEQEQTELAERARRFMCRAEELERQIADSQNQVQKLESPVADLGATYSMSDAPSADADSQCQGDLLRQSEARYDKLKLDCQILQAKYRESKEDAKRFEQKIKDQRLEMEGKLDKMKNKMRSLYTAEVTRMKEKQERDAAGTRAELEALTAQNVKYEEHTRKLSNQIVRLNEKILEQQKQHAIISTKLRHLQMQPVAEPHKPTPPAPAPAPPSASISSAASNDDWQPFKRPNAPSSNLAMEDEEGEVFNNTYLTDLKLGRVPDVITAEELNYRNSLQPPHLKSAYAAQYDLGSHDEDFKDGPHSLDDSMSALLSSSTSHGTRKKSMGTHYKRPGPPTPSKHGGRLSFGSSEPPREILRECSDHNNGSSKTPARFKFLSSRFSVGSSGLPRDELPRRKRSNLLTGMQRRRLQRQVDGVFCTSTPRKSRSYYDQQRLIRVSDAATTPAVDADQDQDAVELAEQLDTVESVAEQPEAGNQADDQGTPHLSNGALFAITKGHTRRITGHVPAQRRKGRVSLCLHGNIFAKSRPAGGTKINASSMAGKIMQQRRKLRQDRVGRFDQGRHLENVRLSGNLTYSVVKSGDNNNYSLHNRNEEQSPPPPVATTFLVDTAERAKNQVEQGQDHSPTWQLRQQFEMENLASWQSFSEENSPGLFEQLCKDTASTAPFQLEPLVYKDQVLEVPILSRSSSNVTEASCSTTQTNVTSGASVVSAASTLSVASTLSAASAVSSRKSCTVFSLSSFHVQPLPHVNVTYVQRTDSRMQPVRDHSLRDQCWRFLGQLGLVERLVVVVALLLIVVLCSHLAHRMVLAFSALLAGMVLLMVIMPGRQ